MLVHAGIPTMAGTTPVIACRAAIAEVLTDDADTLSAVNELSASLL